jgi:hypothetical protein
VMRGNAAGAEDAHSNGPLQAHGFAAYLGSRLWPAQMVCVQGANAGLYRGARSLEW